MHNHSKILRKVDNMLKVQKVSLPFGKSIANIDFATAFFDGSGNCHCRFHD